MTIAHHLYCINHHNEELSVMNGCDFLNRGHLSPGLPGQKATRKGHRGQKEVKKELKKGQKIPEVK